MLDLYKNIKERRLALKMSQDTLAKLLDIRIALLLQKLKKVMLIYLNLR